MSNNKDRTPGFRQFIEIVTTCIGILSLAVMICSGILAAIAIAVQLLGTQYRTNWVGITVDLAGVAVSLCGGGALLQLPFWVIRYRFR